MPVNGWHRVYNFDVYVENGKVIRGTDENHTRTLYPYRSDKYGYTNYSGAISLDGLRAGLKSGNMILR